MKSSCRLAFAIAVLCMVLGSPSAAQTPASPATGDAQIYEKFRAWMTAQPADAQGDPLDRYRGALAASGLGRAEIERQLRIIREQGQQLEIERWNRILTSSAPAFNTKPNAFLVDMTRDRAPGRALDVGMGQGRNALYLAQQGWTVTGFDPADKAVAAAQEEAKRLGVPLTALVMRDDQFDFGRNQWDLIVLSYVGVRDLAPRLYDALKPGGIVVVEAFHRDATKSASIGGAVVFDTNELLKLFERFRVLHYEDVEGPGDFGRQRTRLVRLCAQKP
ncbi:MAG TPA: class I SAM-dependent methyltransferase [Vicinamibacterales bacterium]|jgi:SAM-dependent methyltransferase|nr:class I SAM-dependent methyltransferase [Vicinamibacterales bacterium]